MRWAVILAGGAGTRFWPLSRPGAPKQLLPLAGDRPTLVDAVDRLEGLVDRERIILVTGPPLAEHVARLVTLPVENVLVEPQAASTAPALVWATHEIRRRDPAAEIVTTHADWAVPDRDAFRDAAATACDVAARFDRLVTVGIVPSRPETGYGYIMPGPPLDTDARKVARFVEKPDGPRALDLIAAGALWNSGLFAWTAERLLKEVAVNTPEVAPAVPCLDRGDIEEFFETVVPISIDVGLLERSNRVAVVPGHFEWDDIGNWEALYRVRPKDADGNVLVGRVHPNQSSDCLLWSDTDPIVADGVKDLIVIHANGRILVTTRERAARLKRVLDALPYRVRELEDE